MNKFSNDAGWSVGEIYGHRVFNIIYNRIESPIQAGFPWTDGVNVSKCYSCKSKRRPNCNCGFYAYYNHKDQEFQGDVRGVVRGFGMVDKGTRGFKAEKAEIEALSIPSKFIPKGALIKEGLVVGTAADTAIKSRMRSRWDSMSKATLRNMALLFGLLIVIGSVGFAVAFTLSLMWTLVSVGFIAINLVMYAKMIKRLAKKVSYYTNGMDGFDWYKFRSQYPNVKIYVDDQKMFKDYDKIMTDQKASIFKGNFIKSIR